MMEKHQSSWSQKKINLSKDKSILLRLVNNWLIQKKMKMENIQFIYEKLPVDGATFIIEADEDIYSAVNQRT